MCLERGRGFGNRGGARSGVDELASPLAAAGTDVDEVVGGADDGFLVLDDDEGVAEIAEPLHHADELADIARVQADGGLVEDEESAREARTEAGREIDALRLAAREGAGGTVEIEVAEPDLLQVAEPVHHLAVQHRSGFVRVGDGNGRDEGGEVVDRELPEFGQGPSCDLEGEGLGFQAGALAGLAEGVASVAAQEDPDMHTIGARLEPVEETAHAIPDPLAPRFVRIAAFALEDPFLVLGVHLVEGRHEAEPAPSRRALEILLAFVIGVALEGAHEPLGDG